jgi:hypothetical protein
MLCNNAITFYVQDSGIGIDAKKIDIILKGSGNPMIH